MKIGAYEVLETLPRRATGVVYRAQAPNGDEVAIRLLEPGAARRFAQLERERALRGAPGLTEGFVPVLDSGETADGCFLVAPFLREGTLRDRLAEGPLGVEEAHDLFRELAVALARAHNLGYVHLNLTPGNIFFEAGRPLIADLGIGRHLVAVPSPDSPYIAPEQRGQGAVGFEADTYALGAICCECIFGAPPQAGERVRDLAARTAAPSPRLDPAFELILNRSLAVVTRQRFGNGSAVVIALQIRRAATPANIALIVGALLAFVALAVEVPRAVVFLVGMSTIGQWCLYGSIAFKGLREQVDDRLAASEPHGGAPA